MIRIPDATIFAFLMIVLAALIWVMPKTFLANTSVPLVRIMLIALEAALIWRLSEELQEVSRRSI